MRVTSRRQEILFNGELDGAPLCFICPRVPSVNVSRLRGGHQGHLQLHLGRLHLVTGHRGSHDETTLASRRASHPRHHTEAATGGWASMEEGVLDTSGYGTVCVEGDGRTEVGLGVHCPPYLLTKVRGTLSTPRLARWGLRGLIG